MSQQLDPAGGPYISPEEITEEMREDELLEEEIIAWAARERRISKMREEHFAKSRVRPHIRSGVAVVGYDRATNPAAIKAGVAVLPRPTIGQRIADIAADNPDGFTFHGGRVLEVGKDSGYVVAAKGSPSLSLDKLDAGKISSWVGEHGKGKSVGGWKDSSSGKYVLDVVEVHHDRDTAIRLGRERDEKAIFDIKTGEEISTGGSGRGLID
jgi:hypothetical protein